MKNNYSVLLFLLLSLNFHAQKKTFKCEKVYDAVKLIDTEKYNEAITILRECEKIDPKEYTYPYEIALAYTNNKEHEKAISELKRIKNYDNLKADYFQLLGNNFDYQGKSELAIATYDEGLKKFPDAGRLYLEKGVVYESEKKYNEAINSYEKGISVNPSYSSNYYRAAKLYLRSDNKLSGFIFGEIFVNLERTTKRTKEMSKLLYDGYKEAIIFKDDNNLSISICKNILIDVSKLDKNKLPLCSMFEANLLLSTTGQKEFSLNSFAKIRSEFLKMYLEIMKKEYQIVLFDYFKKMDDNKVFNAYNHYIFQIGDESAFTEWMQKNDAEYQKFVTWYTQDENLLMIDKNNVYVSN
ncbi:tetratricopeptide repeat protein [Chryseobacterium formosus]|uniref:Tetratricopeptide repeat protein n=1 Tax=Chryseobacterium formosus TaxID=1537363 RepID=A0ABT3XLP2_9FLAO|nr:tetratricopeptide repeat protein [Chryseobacterium formosus]MCX8523024.1 tetratricopeptide repeat protein [Chryseobacterium formosus]